MTNQDAATKTPIAPEEQVIPFATFLEAVHPSVAKPVEDLWSSERNSVGATSIFLGGEEIRLHCPECDGVRTYRVANQVNLYDQAQRNVFVTYACGDCRKAEKQYSLLVATQANGRGTAYKYGENPPFGVPVPKKVLRLFGSDSATFLKGRQCENQGLGIGAFAYYRRVVEKHKDEIIGAIIGVCETLKAPPELMAELRSAQGEFSFTGAVEKVKHGLPQGLLINGHNPLVALHGALSDGLHSASDAECLAAANAVRLVLTDLAEKMSFLKQDNTELQHAVQLLLSKRVSGGGTE